MQNIQFGAARASRLSDQVAAHSGGSARDSGAGLITESDIEPGRPCGRIADPPRLTAESAAPAELPGRLAGVTSRGTCGIRGVPGCGEVVAVVSREAA
jgi:hypothetical protein